MDERMRALERAARGGDAEAAERLAKERQRAGQAWDLTDALVLNGIAGCVVRGLLRGPKPWGTRDEDGMGHGILGLPVGTSGRSAGRGGRFRIAVLARHLTREGEDPSARPIMWPSWPYKAAMGHLKRDIYGLVTIRAIQTTPAAPDIGMNFARSWRESADYGDRWRIEAGLWLRGHLLDRERRGRR